LQCLGAAGLGATGGKALHQGQGARSRRPLGDRIPIGGADLIVAYHREIASKGEAAVTRSITRAVGEAKGSHVKALEGAIADAQKKMAEGSG